MVVRFTAESGTSLIVLTIRNRDQTQAYVSQQQPNPTKIQFKSKIRKSVREKVARYQGKRNVFKSFLKDSKLGLRRKATGREFHTDAEA